MKIIWEFVHNTIAHPLMGISFNSEWSVLFHDYTAEKAFKLEDSDENQ